MQTHLEPLAEPAPGGSCTTTPREIERAVVSVTGRSRASSGRSTRTTGSIVLVTLALEGGVSLADAHAEATAVSERIRAALPGVADVVVPHGAVAFRGIGSAAADADHSAPPSAADP